MDCGYLTNDQHNNKPRAEEPACGTSLKAPGSGAFSACSPPHRGIVIGVTSECTVPSTAALPTNTHTRTRSSRKGCGLYFDILQGSLLVISRLLSFSGFLPREILARRVVTLFCCCCFFFDQAKQTDLFDWKRTFWLSFQSSAEYQKVIIFPTFKIHVALRVCAGF